MKKIFFLIFTFLIFPTQTFGFSGDIIVNNDSFNFQIYQTLDDAYYLVVGFWAILILLMLWNFLAYIFTGFNKKKRIGKKLF